MEGRICERRMSLVWNERVMDGETDDDGDEATCVTGELGTDR